MALRYRRTADVPVPSRSDTELAINIKKATSPEETAPKRKHVRSCIVYTWDHKSGQSFWAGLKVCVHPFVSSESQPCHPVVSETCFVWFLRRGGTCLAPREGSPGVRMAGACTILGWGSYASPGDGLRKSKRKEASKDWSAGLGAQAAKQFRWEMDVLELYC